MESAICRSVSVRSPIRFVLGQAPRGGKPAFAVETGADDPLFAKDYEDASSQLAGGMDDLISLVGDQSI